MKKQQKLKKKITSRFARETRQIAKRIRGSHDYHYFFHQLVEQSSHSYEPLSTTKTM